jgi:hypothetical protein
MKRAFPTGDGPVPSQRRRYHRLTYRVRGGVPPDDNTIGRDIVLIGASASGGTFVLAVDDPQLLRTLKITGLDGLFDIEPSLTEAMEHVVERVPAGV